MHAVPPQSAPQVLIDSKDLTNDAGFVNVNQMTLQHNVFPNVFAIGDCSSTPNSKTMAAIGNVHSVFGVTMEMHLFFFLIVLAGQVGVLHKNINKYLKGKSLDSKYDGYASCPLVTGYDSCIMAEFDYDLQPKETFPFRQDRERYSMFLVKRDIFPFLYWHLMLNGYWNGPALFRKIFSIFKRK